MKKIISIAVILLCTTQLVGQSLDSLFLHPPPSARPWVFWYWLNAAVSREGIKADLQAMKDAGIGGAYLMTIKGKTDPPLIDPPIEQLTPQWWDIVHYAMKEADSLGLQIGMHVSDGFALAGGPWITPELSMQKVVWTISSPKDTLPQPETNEGYYRDIAVLAYPSPLYTDATPVVTSSNGDAHYLAAPGNKETFKSTTPCWIQYAYDKPFTCRSIIIHTNGNNYQAHRLGIAISDDGINFRPAGKMESPRHGWQDTDADVTYSIPATTAPYFRFLYDNDGSEPGAEDLDAAKWKQSLKVAGITLSPLPRIHQYEGKTGAVWRISQPAALPDSLCIPLDKIIDITDKMDTNGALHWKAPAGNWTVIRIGHTSTGHTNATGGAGKGLECDKFNPVAVRTQFDHWYGEALRRSNPALKMFHVDSWECGSQNWSPVFREAFHKKRGYDLLKYLPAMAGIPVQSAAKSEQFLHDIRETITELVQQNFYDTLAVLAHAKGSTFSAESVAPTMTSDGMLHYSAVDIPMGEFWLRSPTHDKPNDMLDAISGAHIYGKKIIQAEAFTSLRIQWDEYPGMLKTLQDRNYALGINRMVYHVFMHNPWMDRQPGMTLNGIGLYFQRDQTWWKPGSAWVTYAQRCQALLQQGRPVADIAVFTGTEIPRRAVLPEKLVPILPGIFGDSIVKKEQTRLANKGTPVREIPSGVTSSANVSDPADWVDPLHGYAYDSFNPDALMRLATVRNGRIELPGGASYKLLIVPVTPSQEIRKRLDQLVKEGATVLSNDKIPWQKSSFSSLGLSPDIEVPSNIAWTHRTAPGFDLYFISNQDSSERIINASFRISGRIPELWNPVNGEQHTAGNWHIVNGRTTLPLQLPANGSVFVIFRKPATAKEANGKNWETFTTVQELKGPWKVVFNKDTSTFEKLTDWSKNLSDSIRYFSGTANYTQTFSWHGKTQVQLSLGEVANLAEIKVNNIPCGIVWTAPYSVDITHALKQGENNIEIAVTNTWANHFKKTLLKAGLLGPVELKTNLPDSNTMKAIYSKIKTPYKYGLVMTPSDNSKKMDCPSIFRKDDKWYMVYIVFDGKGYETWLAKSNDLLHWKTLGKMMSFSDSTNWDATQKAGYIALQDYQWGGSYKWNEYNGQHWMSYIGGAEHGYEQGLLSIGIAHTNKDITTPHEWQRLDKPVLKATDKDVRWWENNTIYKSSIIHDKDKITGYPFVMYYNAKGDSLKPKRGKERIGMAVSNDMEHWIRYGKEPVLDHFTGITGDAVIQKINNIWVMFYFGAFWKNRPNAFNRFACSYDLVHWQDWQGEDLITSSEKYDERFAHKSFVIYYNGVVYHFYCAVNKADQRGIAVATSKDMGKSKITFSKL
ncbi:alpha-L-rhamnosidase [Chitinophaga sp. YR573]|uniref:glycosyl hydrolase n=1 Tax=Chitinophaga sp. YR573 TaxID=1881040 RepID=UPI0008C80A61|nr:glycosyl hydrolase [Chitinophaga sp. YR573]SEW22323.1 alpha-L-rhamnosidase [Chitinophaga sp. YR573]